MANLELTFNPKKTLKRSDVIKMGELISKQVQDKTVDTLIIKITDDTPAEKGGANSIMFPFRIINDK